MEGFHRAVRSMRRMAFLAVLSALFFLTGMALFQDRLLYFPASGSLADSLAATRLKGAVAWPAADDYRGIRVDPTGGRTLRGTIVVFHGNAGHAGHRGEYAERLGAAGWRVILAEYPGYGPRPGSPGEDRLVGDAAATIERVRQDFGGPVLVLGESLGAAVAAGAVGTTLRRGGTVDGLILVTPWDTLARVAAHHYPWLPVRLLLADRYDSLGALRSWSGPTAVVVAARDDVVPARFGRALFDGLGGRKALFAVEEAGHNDWPDRVDDVWWSRLAAAVSG